MSAAPDSRRPVILGLTGPNAAGKGEVAAYLVEHGFVVHSLSDVVRDEAARRGLAAERENLILIGNELRSAEGPGTLARRILPRLGSRDVVDSIRNPAEVAVLREVEGFALLGVNAPVETRFTRSVRRGRPGDPATLAAFESREREENTADPVRQQLAATFLLADHVVTNDGTLADLRRAVDAVVAELDPRS